MIPAAAIPQPWFAVRVKPNFENVAAASLEARGFEHFLPTFKKKRQWTDRVKTSDFPLFPGYLFCRFDAHHRTPVLASPGVIGIVACGAQLAPVSDEEIQSLRRVVIQNVPAEPSPFIGAGHRVRVMHGVLTGIEGVILEQRSKCRLIVQISLLQRGVSVEIDPDWVEPVMKPCS